MVITYPAEVVNFQVVRPDPEPELEGLQRVSIGIDDNNFPKIFPPRHIEFLDKLKGQKHLGLLKSSEIIEILPILKFYTTSIVLDPKFPAGIVDLSNVGAISPVSGTTFDIAKLDIVASS
ncbi:hypothetical protein BGZ81_002334 [Podila clonocystis]|nr:hypothetical protein BGZ81_002334 [Podila clonocystis]